MTDNALIKNNFFETVLLEQIINSSHLKEIQKQHIEVYYKILSALLREIFSP